MRIAMYADSFLPRIGGRELAVHHLTKALAEQGHDVRVVGPAGWWRHRHERDYGYPVHRWPTLRGLLREEVSRFTLRLDTAIWRADVVHVHNTYPNGYAMSAGKGFSIPYVLTPHGADIHKIPKLGYGLRLDPELDRKIRRAVAKASAVTAISAGVQASLINAGADPEAIRRIPNGVDLRRFSEYRPHAELSRFGIEPQHRLIVSTGNYHPRKGHEVLVRAMLPTLESEPDARLVIIGRTRDSFRAFVHELGLSEKIINTGELPLPEKGTGEVSAPDWLAEILLRADMYVCASLDSQAEGLSLALLEAMAAHRAVIATRISGNLDIVEHGRSGLLVPTDDALSLAEAMVSILEDGELRRTLADGARAVAEQYDWHEIARRYAALYAECA